MTTSRSNSQLRRPSLQYSPARDSGADSRLLRSVIPYELAASRSWTKRDNPNFRRAKTLWAGTWRALGWRKDETGARETKGGNETTRRNWISIILGARRWNSFSKRWCSKLSLVLLDPVVTVCSSLDETGADLPDRSIHFGELWWVNDSILLVLLHPAGGTDDRWRNDDEKRNDKAAG